LAVPAEAYEFDPAWEVIAVEEPLLGAINGVAVQGRLDAIIKWNDKYWSLQWKTYSALDGLADLITYVQLSWHEPCYQELAKQNNYEPWGGTILGACLKLPGYRIVNSKREEVTDEQRVAAFRTHAIARSAATQERIIHHLGLQLADMKERWNLQIRNHEACWGTHGRMRCPYFGVCHDGGSLDSSEFRTAPERYPIQVNL